MPEPVPITGPSCQPVEWDTPANQLAAQRKTFLWMLLRVFGLYCPLALLALWWVIHTFPFPPEDVRAAGLSLVVFVAVPAMVLPSRPHSQVSRVDELGVSYGTKKSSRVNWANIKTWQVVYRDEPIVGRALQLTLRSNHQRSLLLPGDERDDQIITLVARMLPDRPRLPDKYCREVGTPAALVLLFTAVLGSIIAGLVLNNYLKALAPHIALVMGVLCIVGPGTLWALIGFPRRIWKDGQILAFALYGT